MAGSLTGYYGRAKTGIANIDPAEMAQLGEDYLIVAATGAGVALAGSVLDGLDKKVLGVPVPVDGVISVGLGVLGLSMGGNAGEALKVASIAAGGSAAVRTFGEFFKRVGVRGDFTDLDHDRLPGYEGTYGPTFGFGAGAQDRLVQAARYL
jgi:hypothetical protein